ncbi:hypothetical protein SDC9_76578 [bioreactor metagenome]|uniref:Uncharacterized protein n=1 Tax=bioreactor metagenome TaxID=1076179 RepID=A0A644YNE8_9ZZZZ
MVLLMAAISVGLAGGVAIPRQVLAVFGQTPPVIEPVPIAPSTLRSEALIALGPI